MSIGRLQRARDAFYAGRFAGRLTSAVGACEWARRRVAATCPIVPEHSSSALRPRRWATLTTRSSRERYTVRSAYKRLWAWVERSPPREVLSKRLRRSLKTQQHAHLRSRIDHGVRPGSTRHGSASAYPVTAKSQVEKYPVIDGTTVYGSLLPMTAFREVLHGEFDPGSGRTLAACLTHASGATNQGLPWGRAANG